MNSQKRIAAVRYATAYDQLGGTVQQAQARAQELAGAVAVLANAGEYMQNPRIPLTYKKLVLQELLRDFPQAARFIAVLLDAKRYDLLPEINHQVQTLLDDRKGISRAIITSAQVLSDAQQQAASQALGKRLGKTVQATFKTDASLLGGLTFACEGKVIDGSLKKRLAKLQAQITK